MGNRIVVIGASLSGIDALSTLIEALPADFPAPIFITQHVASHSPGMLPQILSGAGKLCATHPKSPELFENGHIYVAPPDRHMLIAKGYVRLSHGPQENLARPAIDPLFRSAALAYGPAVIGVVLTGQLDDGTAGLLAIKDHGGTTMVQEPNEATARSMPLSALRHVPIDYRCPSTTGAPWRRWRSGSSSWRTTIRPMSDPKPTWRCWRSKTASPTEYSTWRTGGVWSR